MEIAVFDTRAYDRDALDAANARYGHGLRFFEPRLTSRTATLASGVPVVCPFVNCRIDAETIDALHRGGTRLLALRSAGFNHVDLDAAAHQLQARDSVDHALTGAGLRSARA